MLLLLIHYSHVQCGRTALIVAASNGRTDTVKYLVENTNVQVNATDNVSHSNCVKCVHVLLWKLRQATENSNHLQFTQTLMQYPLV